VTQWTPLAIVSFAIAFGMVVLVLLAVASSLLAEYFIM
jgi:hypothetical protein